MDGTGSRVDTLRVAAERGWVGWGWGLGWWGWGGRHALLDLLSRRVSFLSKIKGSLMLLHKKSEGKMGLAKRTPVQATCLLTLALLHS